MSLWKTSSSLLHNNRVTVHLVMLGIVHRLINRSNMSLPPLSFYQWFPLTNTHPGKTCCRESGKWNDYIFRLKDRATFLSSQFSAWAYKFIFQGFKAFTFGPSKPIWTAFLHFYSFGAAISWAFFCHCLLFLKKCAAQLLVLFAAHQCCLNGACPFELRG